MSETTNLSDEVYLDTATRRTITLCNYNYSQEGVYHPDRILQEYDLLYMREGSWNIWEEDNCYPLSSNQVLLLEPGKHHFSLEKCSPNMRNLYIHFTSCASDGDPATGFRLAKLTDCNDNREIYPLFEKIVEVFWSDHVESRSYRLSALFDELLIALSDLNSSRQEKKDSLVADIIHQFHCNPERFFTSQELAEYYQVSLRTISGRFKKATGLSVHQYQLQLKLNMAYDALPFSPGRGLRDIAHSFGFYDEFQFSKLFKRQFGIPPSKRRNPQ